MINVNLSEADISSRPCFCGSRFINQTPKQSFLQGLSDENKTEKQQDTFRRA